MNRTAVLLFNKSFVKRKTHKGHIFSVNKFNGALAYMDDRDKTIKTIQHVIKILLYYKLIKAKKWAGVVAQLSLAIQILYFGVVSSNLHKLTNHRIKIKEDLVVTVIFINSIINAISDDVYCLWRIGVLRDSRWKHVSKVVSTYCWLIRIIFELKYSYEIMCGLEAESTTKENEKAGFENLKMAQISVVKLVADLLFCGCDIFHPSFSEGLQAWSGFIGAYLAGYKVYKKMPNL